MYEIEIPSLYLLAGIMVYATIHHLTIALKPPRNTMEMLFAGICLCTVLLAVFHSRSLQTTNNIDFVRALKETIASGMLFYPLFIWFVALRTGIRPRSLLVALTVLFTGLFVINLAQPYSLQYDQFGGIYYSQLPWGEVIARGKGHNGPWTFIAIAGIVVASGYGLYALVTAFHRERKRTDLFLIFAIGILILFQIEGILVRLSILDFVELGPFGILAMVIVISTALTREMQQQLITSERNFRSLFENSPVGMVAIDPDNGRIMQANQIALNMTGYSTEESLTRTVADVISPEEREDSRQRYEQLAGGLVDHMHYERRFLRKDGSSIQSEIFISTLKDDKDKVVRFIASAIDITERKSAEEALEVREAQLKTLIESVPDSIQFKDGEGRWLIANEVCLRLFGLKGEQWRNLTDLEIGLLHPRLSTVMSACKSGDEKAWQAGGTFHDEEIVVDPQGNTINFDVVKVPLFDERDRRKALIIIARDVTERKQAEASLKESELRFRTIVEQSPVAISFSRDGYSLDVNAAHLKMFGYDSAEEVRGKPVINQIAPQCRGDIEDRVRRRIEGLPTETTYETTGLRRDGTQFPLVVSAKRMIFSDGPVSTAFLIDFTERAQMQQSIERIGKLYKMLSEINSANIQIRNRGQLFETACRIAVESGMIRMACIALLDRESGEVGIVANAGHVQGFFDKLKINIHDEIIGNGPIGTAIKSGTYIICNDIGSDPRMAPWRDDALKRGYRATIAFPLKQSDQVIGAFALYFHDAGSLTDDVTQLLGSLVEDICFTLDFIDESARREQVQNELRELSTFLQSALENERKRIARELHDELGQTMTALHFDLKWLHEQIDSRQKKIQARLRSMQALIERTVSTVRRISEDLRPGMLDDLGLAAAIEHHAEKFSAQTGINCDLAMNVTEFDLSDQAATALFRIVQESLTNVARHSSATRVTIRLQDIGDKILLIVQDNGRGLPDGPPNGKKTYGLMGMRERVRMLEGVMDIFNEAGSGVRIETFIPKHPTTRAQQ